MTIAGVSPISIFMLARRSPSHTMIAIASRPARTPQPCHMLTPYETMPVSISCQLKIETIRNTIVPPSTSLAPWVSFEMSILRAFPFSEAGGPSQSSLRYETNTTGSVRLLSPQVGNRLPPGVAPCGRGARLRAPSPSPPPRSAPARRRSTIGVNLPIFGDERDHRRPPARALADEPPPSGRGAAIPRTPAHLRPAWRAARARGDRRDDRRPGSRRCASEPLCGSPSRLHRQPGRCLPDGPERPRNRVCTAASFWTLVTRTKGLPKQEPPR